MIDRQAIYILYNDQVGKKLVERFYQLLVVYSQNKKTKPVESCLLKLNDIARKKKTRLFYYDNHSLKEDLSQFVVEEYRLSKIKQK
jgi:hypothetical protein